MTSGKVDHRCCRQITFLSLRIYAILKLYSMPKFRPTLGLHQRCRITLGYRNLAYRNKLTIEKDYFCTLLHPESHLSREFFSVYDDHNFFLKKDKISNRKINY